MKSLIVMALFISTCGCTIEMRPTQEVESKLEAHAAVLGAIADYINKLQEAGALPKPDAMPVKNK